MLDVFIELIILILMAWIFEHKIIPQVITMFIAIYTLVVEFNGGATPEWIILFSAVVVYSGFQIATQEKEE